MLHEKAGPQDKARRGRPKGSGIDDTTRLETIARMLAADPNLKPTTAIKNIGITDPSAIRRLRDKFHEFSAAQTDVLKTAFAPAAANASQAPNVLPMLPTPVATARDEPAKAPRNRAVPTAGPAPARKVEAAQSQPAKTQAVKAETVVPLPAKAHAKIEAPAPQPTTPQANAEAPVAPVTAAAASSAQPTSPFAGGDPATAWLMMWAGIGIRVASAAIEAQLALGAQLFRAPPVAMALKGQIGLNEMATSIWKPLGPRVKAAH